MQLGPYTLPNNLALAPMAGVTDRVFRELCKRLGAGFAPSEMVTSDVRLWKTEKSRRRMDHEGEPEPRIVQIAGGDPKMIAEAARLNVERGAQIIDINLGCPAKKVCRKMAGSALLRDENLVRQICEAAVDAVDVPVTLKTRTGWSPDMRNGVRIARIAEDAGIQAIAVHGRTRACKFTGPVDYKTIRDVKREVRIPVIANGDIETARDAHRVLEITKADGLMIGRAAQGRPWIFREIAHHLNAKSKKVHEITPDNSELRDIMLAHLQNLYAFYGEHTGVRVARKHLSWYLSRRPQVKHFRDRLVRVESSSQQVEITKACFDEAHIHAATSTGFAVGSSLHQ